MSDTLVLRGGTVFDGLGSPGVVADVVIADGVIRAVAPGAARGETGARTIADLAAQRGKDGFDTLCDLVAATRPP